MADVFEEEATKAAKSQTTYTAFLATHCLTGKVTQGELLPQ